MALQPNIIIAPRRPKCNQAELTRQKGKRGSGWKPELEEIIYAIAILTFGT